MPGGFACDMTFETCCVQSGGFRLPPNLSSHTKIVTPLRWVSTWNMHANFRKKLISRRFIQSCVSMQ